MDRDIKAPKLDESIQWNDSSDDEEKKLEEIKKRRDDRIKLLGALKPSFSENCNDKAASLNGNDAKNIVISEKSNLTISDVNEGEEEQSQPHSESTQIVEPVSTEPFKVELSENRPADKLDVDSGSVAGNANDMFTDDFDIENP